MMDKRPSLLYFLDLVGTFVFAISGAKAEIQRLPSFWESIAVGGGVLRDILLKPFPIIIEKEIYASAALIVALIVCFGAAVALQN